MKHHTLYPNAIAIVDEAEVQTGTFFNLGTILDNGFSDFQLGTEAITVTKGRESFEPEIFTPGGNLKIDSFTTARTCTVQATMGAWYHAIHAIMEGMHPDDVKSDYSVNKDGAQDTPDVTDAQAAVTPETILSTHLTMLVRFPIRVTGKDLYLFLPRCVVPGDQPESQMNLGTQQKPAINFEGISFADEDDLDAHKGIFSGVNGSNVAYFFTA